MSLSLGRKDVPELKSRSKIPANSLIHVNNPATFILQLKVLKLSLSYSTAVGLSSFSDTCLKAVRQIPFLLNEK